LAKYYTFINIVGVKLLVVIATQRPQETHHGLRERKPQA
jgi:hypothetical protein